MNATTREPQAYRRPTRFVLIALGCALVIGMVVSYFAADTPDALQRAVITTACEQASDKEACLARQEGEPLLNLFPGSISGYKTLWLSGLVGVLVTFAAVAGLMVLARWGRSSAREGGGTRADRQANEDGSTNGDANRGTPPARPGTR